MLRAAKMAKQRTLNTMFATIRREEMQAKVERDFATLKTKMELEKIMDVVVVKRLVGRPRKTIDAIVFLTTSVGSTSQTSRSSENNCFPYVFRRLVVSCEFRSICFAKFVRQI
jgi:hypothetical protein